jgi:hypothetical protein
MDKLKAIKALVDAYYEEDHDARSELERLSAEAEESSDYYRYDQACYDTWEHMWDRGTLLADQIERVLKEKA